MRAIFLQKMLHWINWIVLLSLEPLAGELKHGNGHWRDATDVVPVYWSLSTGVLVPQLLQHFEGWLSNT